MLTVDGLECRYGKVAAVRDLSLEVGKGELVSLIGATHSRSGLRVRTELDRSRYPDGVTVTDAQMATVRLNRHEFHGDWNYTIAPTAKRRRRSLIH